MSDLRRTHPLLLAASAGLAAGALLVASAVSVSTSLAGGPTTDTLTTVAQPLDPEVVLPARVDAALQRTLAASARATAAVDDRQQRPARKALTATRQGLTRAHLATLRQVEAAPPPDSEAESTAGPDSLLALLNVDQVTITGLAGLFDRVTAPSLTAALKSTLNVALDRRASMLTTILALDPEEAGAPYTDALVDTVPAYSDEVAALTEALRDDHLTATGRASLQAALQKSKAAEAKMLAAFGGAD